MSSGPSVTLRIVFEEGSLDSGDRVRLGLHDVAADLFRQRAIRGSSIRPGAGPHDADAVLRRLLPRWKRGGQFAGEIAASPTGMLSASSEGKK